MMKAFLIILIVASATIFSCANTKQEKENPGNEKEEVKDNSIVAEADRIAYSYHPSTVAPKYYRGYTITVTGNNLHLAINSYSDTLLRKDWPFTEEKFNDVKKKLKKLKEDGDIDESEIADGGTSETITLYKNGKHFFEGEDYRRTKNFSGASIDLSYLVPDLKELIEGTEIEDKN